LAKSILHPQPNQIPRLKVGGYPSCIPAITNFTRAVLNQEYRVVVQSFNCLKEDRERLIPDSAVAIDGKREARSFRNEVDGFVPLSRHRSAVLRRAVELHRNDLTKSQKDIETSESDAFAAPGLHLASQRVPFNCGIRVQSNCGIRVN
jgi:hypothetical protein